MGILLKSDLSDLFKNSEVCLVTTGTQSPLQNLFVDRIQEIPVAFPKWFHLSISDSKQFRRVW
jgi:hypothetical protein